MTRLIHRLSEYYLPLLTSLLLVLILFETVLYFLFMRISSVQLDMLHVFRLILSFLFCWFLLYISFIVEKDTVIQWITRLRREQGHEKEELKRKMLYYTFFIIVVFIYTPSHLFSRFILLVHSIVDPIIEPLIFIILLGMAINVINSSVHSLSKEYQDFHKGSNSWILSNKYSFLFYIAYIGVAWVNVEPWKYANSDWNMWFLCVYFKDVIIFVIIINLLFFSLYKFTRHKMLGNIIRSRALLRSLVALCLLVAIIAIGADLMFLDSSWNNLIHFNSLQIRLGIMHSYVRDIFLFLPTIFVFLTWVFANFEEYDTSLQI
jgi:hypothetical protein